MNKFRFKSFCQISGLVVDHFSLMSAPCMSSSDGIEGQRKFIFSIGNVEFHHPMSKSIVPSADGTEDQTISADSMEMDLHISQSCVLSTESTDAQLIPTHPVQPVEICLFNVKSGLCATPDSFVDVLSSSCTSWALTFPEFRRSIVFYPATNMSNLGDIG
jgi:hypothetical protein